MKKKLLSILLFFIVALFTITGVFTIQVQAAEYYTAFFETYGGTPEPYPQTLAADSLIQKPADPHKAGYVFQYWYYFKPMESTPTIWDFETDGIYFDFIMMAYYEGEAAPAQYTVVFDTNGGTPGPASQNIAEGGVVTQPSSPTKPDHQFEYWYFADPDTGTDVMWDFDAGRVYEDMTLAARWSAVIPETTEPSSPDAVDPEQPPPPGETPTAPPEKITVIEDGERFVLQGNPRNPRQYYVFGENDVALGYLELPAGADLNTVNIAENLIPLGTNPGTGAASNLMYVMMTVSFLFIILAITIGKSAKS